MCGKNRQAKAKRRNWFTRDLSPVGEILHRPANSFHRNLHHHDSNADVFILVRNMLLKIPHQINLMQNINSVDKQRMW